MGVQRHAKYNVYASFLKRASFNRDSQKEIGIVKKFLSPTFYLHSVLMLCRLSGFRCSLFQNHPFYHFSIGADWPYEMKYVKSYCYFGIIIRRRSCTAVAFLYYYKRSCFYRWNTHGIKVIPLVPIVPIDE